MADLTTWVWFSAAGFSLKAKRLLLEQFGSPEELFRLPDTMLKELPGLNPREQDLLEARDLRDVPRILDACQQQGIRLITLRDAAYPSSLKNIYFPPPVLYVKGQLPALDLDPSVAVIGTRSATPYGIKMGREIAYEIARCGGIVLSGLTVGIDAAAAEACLLAGGRCIGVLGTSHEQERGKLAEDVASTGALVSEYPPGTASQRYFFRERNRITSGLSDAVVVVEAPERSGAILFAREALEQGKEIFAVPGNADAKNSAGTLELLREGAVLATCGWDVMQEFAARYPGRIKRAPERPAPPSPTEREKEIGMRPAQAEEPAPQPLPTTAALAQLKQQLEGLPEDQRKIMNAVIHGAGSIDEIIDACDLPGATVLAKLTVLQIKGYLRRDAKMRIQLNLKTK